MHVLLDNTWRSAVMSLTDPLIVGVQQLHERCRRSLCIYELCGLFVQCQLAQHTRGHSLHVFHIRVQQLQAHIHINM